MDAAAKAKYGKLIAELEDLKKFALQQTEIYVSSTEKLYEGLAKTYLWWRQAKKEKEFLEQLYADRGIQFKKVIDQKINFSPLLRYLWNMESKTSSATLHQWSRALNKIHVAYEKGDGYFKNEPVLRIVEFIKNKGGLLKLGGFVVTDEYKKEKATNKRPKKIDEAMQSRHLQEGDEYFDSEAPAIATLSVAEPLPVTDDQNFTLALLRKRKNNYELLSVVEDCGGHGFSDSRIS